jgi:prolyl-tRNA synthetase
MALPVIQGTKTENERFAGAVETRCIEAMMQDGKALQAGTSHDLGQNFGRAFNVTFQNQQGVREHVWQTSWGVSTRLVGAVIMAHSDDEGLVLPPRLAPIHVVIVPIWKSDTERTQVCDAAHKLAKELREDGLTVKVDDRDNMRPGDKYYEWERKGVPVRIELGPRDLQAGTVMLKRRIAPVDANGKAVKETLPMQDLGLAVGKILDEFQRFLYERALKFREANTVSVDTWDDFVAVFKGEGSKFVYAHWDGTAATEKAIKEATKATIRCLPYEGQGPAAAPGACIKTGAPSARRVLFAKNY